VAAGLRRLAPPGIEAGAMLLRALEVAVAARGVRRGQGRVVVACSGGADSVALAHAAAALLEPSQVVLAHVHHHVRADAALDADHVRALGCALGVEVQVRDVWPARGDEAELRALRYAALEAVRADVGAACVLTAHTADDQAETVLLYLVRSGRLAALAGIRGARGAIVRPWLEIPRAELRPFLARRGARWREDPTNLEPRHLRNRVRKELLPLLEARYRPGVTRRLARLAAQLQRLGANAALTDAPATSTASSRTIPGPSEGAADQVGAAANEPPAPDVRRWMEGELTLSRAAAPVALPTDRWSAVFDAEVFPQLVVRRVRAGDVIRPHGLGGRKKLQDVLVDAKVPRAVRGLMWVVALPSGEVVWVPGLTRGEGALVGQATRDRWFATCRLPDDGSLSQSRSPAK
jgi:tRNA(Ile)-lysidine synthase